MTALNSENAGCGAGEIGGTAGGGIAGADEGAIAFDYIGCSDDCQGLYPQEIQNLPLDAITTEAATYCHLYGNETEELLRGIAYFGREGYWHLAPIAAMEFAHRVTVGTAKTLREFQTDYPPVPDVARIVARCAVMMNEAETGGVSASYGTWRSVLSICKFSNARDVEIEALTGQHADYSLAAAKAKMQDISAPFLCESFEGGDLCKKCKYRNRVRSPIALGYIREPAAKLGGAK